MTALRSCERLRDSSMPPKALKDPPPKAPAAKTISPMGLPDVLPDLDVLSDVVNMTLLAERMLTEIKKALGKSLLRNPPLASASKGGQHPATSTRPSLRSAKKAITSRRSMCSFSNCLATTTEV